VFAISTPLKSTIKANSFFKNGLANQFKADLEMRPLIYPVWRPDFQRRFKKLYGTLKSGCELAGMVIRIIILYLCFN
jgi:hypothetical protein